MPQDGPKIVPRALLAALGRSWSALGPVLAALGSLLVRLGPILEPLGAILGRLGAILGRSWGILGRPWAPRTRWANPKGGLAPEGGGGGRAPRGPPLETFFESFFEIFEKTRDVHKGPSTRRAALGAAD